MKGGAKVYQRLIESTTTLPLTADEIHDIGLREVARIKSEMEAVKTRTGFKGTLAAILRISAHRPQVRAGDQGGAARRL